MSREELGLERRVPVTEKVPLPRQTVPALIEAIEGIFRQKEKPTRILYEKGGPLIVEKLVAESAVPEDAEFITGYQMVRQFADTEILEAGNPLEMLCQAAMRFAETDHEPSILLTRTKSKVEKWFPVGKVDKILRVPLVEDSDCPEGYLVFAGGRPGETMLSQIEYAIFCKLE